MHPDCGDDKIDVSAFLNPYRKNNQEGGGWNCNYYDNNVGKCENSDN